MYSDACKNFSCRAPLTLVNNADGTTRRLLSWEWNAVAPEPAGLLEDGTYLAASVLASLWSLQPCMHCSEEDPAFDWPRHLMSY